MQEELQAEVVRPYVVAECWFSSRSAPRCTKRRTALTVAGAPTSGSSSVWIRGPQQGDSTDLAERLYPDSVLIEPGAVFFEASSPVCPYFRLGYSSISEHDIPAGIELIEKRTTELAALSPFR